MDLMQEKYPNAFFIVASDDMKWAKENLNSRASMSPFQNNFYDLALLANCQHSIISSGTFSWWAGWLANGTTIYYEDYPRKGSSLSKGLDRSDYYYKDWIPLGD
jgi:galactoside 2-L-fucosyltransferase 1/2